jgi:hypothetical protein
MRMLASAAMIAAAVLTYMASHGPSEASLGALPAVLLLAFMAGRYSAHCDRTRP